MTAVSAAGIAELPPPPVRRWTRERIAGHVLTGLWALAGAGLVLYLVFAWNPELFARWAPAYLRGLGVTLLLVEQNVRAALAIADRGVILVEGELRHQGKAADLVNDPLLAELYLGGATARGAA